MSAPVRFPCSVCGAPVALDSFGRVGSHWPRLPDGSRDRFQVCPGSGALPPAGDLLGAPLAVAPDPEPERAPAVPAFQLDAFNLDLFGG